jgi:tetratricopeptide (TPR) repeat protein
MMIEDPTAEDERIMGVNPVATARAVLRVGVMALCLVFCVDAVVAKNPQAKQAAEEMEFGYKAARRGYWQEALERFELADELTPNQARILNNIAVALEANGRFDEARTTYQLALSLEPGNTRVQANYARFQEFFATFVAEEDDEPDDAGGDDDTAAGSDDDDEEQDDES